MGRMARAREEAEIERQRAAEQRTALVVTTIGAVFLPDEVAGLLRAVLTRVNTFPDREGSLLVEALLRTLARDPSEREEATAAYWFSRLTGSITLPLRDGMPL